MITLEEAKKATAEAISEIERQCLEIIEDNTEEISGIIEGAGKEGYTSASISTRTLNHPNYPNIRDSDIILALKKVLLEQGFYVQLCGRNELAVSWGENEIIPSMEDFYNTYIPWADRTFGQNRHDAAIAHLKREVNELAENPGDESEFADCMMLLFHAWSSAHPMEGIFGLTKALSDKLRVNRGRKLGTPDHEGVVEHID